MARRKIYRFVNEDTVFTLPWDVAIREGLFEAAGLKVELAQKNPENLAEDLFDRNKEALFEGGRLDCYNVCEWGAIKRTAEGKRAGRILNRRESVAAMATLAAPGSDITRPEDLAGVPVGVNLHTGSHYTTLKMLEGFLPKEDIRVVHVGGPARRLRALLEGEIRAATLMEPHISYAEKQGSPLICLAYYNGLLVSGEDLDDETLGRIYEVLRKAVRLINRDPSRYAHLLFEDLPEDLRQGMRAEDLKVERLRYIDPSPYTREEFERSTRWMQEWGLLSRPVAYEELVRTPGCLTLSR